MIKFNIFSKVFYLHSKVICLILEKIDVMIRLVLLIMMLFFTHSLFAQVKVLQEYIEDGHNFHQICKKAEKMIRKNRLEDDAYRENHFRKGDKKEFLDDEKLKFERWKWYWRDRVHSDGTVPDLHRQWLEYQSIVQHAQTIQSRNTPSWKHEGPVRNTGGYWGMGRTTHVSFHPTQANTFYVASPNGGIWKSTDGGTTYTSIADNLPYQPVGIVLADPTNPNVLYATLGEKEGWWQYSLGIYKTTNGGNTWNPSSLNWKLTDNKVIYGLQMNPQNSSILIAATSDGLYKTFNGGNSWIKIRNENFSDVIYRPGDTSTVYAASNDYWGNSEIFKSTDGGNTFLKITSFGLQKVFFRFAVTIADPNYLGLNMSVDGEKKFYLSKNAGQTFEFVSNMPENLVLYFSQTNRSTLYCGYVVIYKSTDGGRSWNQITDWWASGQGLPEIHADHHFIGHHPSRKNELYFGCDGGVYRLNETTGLWSELVNGLAITQFYKMAISTSTPPVLIGGSQDNGGWIRRANGSWGNTNGGDAMTQLIDPRNANIGYTEYWGGNAVYRTTNGFNDLEDITQNIGATLPGQWVTPFNLNPANSKTFIIGYNDVFVSFDRGNTFRAISNNLTGSSDNDLREVRISPVDTQFIVATRANVFYSTKDFGKSWKSLNLVTSLEITDIEFHPKNVNRLWCTRGGVGAIKIMESNNQGNTWSNITRNMPNVPVLCIRFDEASNSLFIGTDFGLFYTDADNIDWQYYGSNLPHTSVTDIEFHQTSRKMYISTYGRGFYSIDLPDCAPAALHLSSSVDAGGFVVHDSIKVCAGSKLTLKSQDGLSGTFHWKGPKLDTTIQNSVYLDLGVFNSFTQSGNYILEYTSPTGCKRLDTLYIRVLNRPSFNVRADGPHLDCHHPSLILNPGMSNDSINFSFNWSGPDSFMVNNYTAVIQHPGTYILNLVNLVGNCSFYDSIYIVKYEDLNLDSVQTIHNICHGDSLGSLFLFPEGGRKPYHILWSNGQQTDSLFSLKSGTYIVNLTDANGCKEIASFDIKQPEPYQVKVTVKNSLSEDGFIHLEVNGSTAPYRFEWYLNNRLYAETEDIEQLKPGLYDVIIRDANNCLYQINGIEIKELVSDEVISAKEIKAYPNPFSGELHLSLPMNFKTDPLFQIVDLNGKILSVPSRKIGNSEWLLDTNLLPTGRYLLKCKLGNEILEFKITKTK